MELKASTAINIAFGPMISTDGTVLSGLTPSNAGVSGIRVIKHGTPTPVNRVGGAATHVYGGYYSCPLSVTDVDTVGTLRLIVATPTTGLAAWIDYNVLPKVQYSAIYGTGKWPSVAVVTTAQTASALTQHLDVNVTSVSGDATAANNLEAAYDGTGYAGGTIRQNVNATSLGGAAADDALSTGVLGAVYEGTRTVKEALTVDTAILTGKSAGGGGNNLTFYGSDGSTVRLSVTVDANGNRTVVDKWTG